MKIKQIILSFIVSMFILGQGNIHAELINPDRQGSIEDIEDLSTEELNDIGSRFFYTGEFDKALEFYEKALAKTTDIDLKANILFNFSSIYLEKGNILNSEEKDYSFYHKSIEYAKRCLDIKPYHWKALSTIATVYMNMGSLEKADLYYTEAGRYVDESSPYYRQLIEHHRTIKAALVLLQKQKEQEKKDRKE